MADNDILQAIQIIDKKIASLQVARNQLAHAFGIESKSSAHDDALAALSRVSIIQHGRRSDAHADSSNGNGNPRGRKIQLVNFFNEHGPMSRTEIVARAGLPEGTVSYCLNDKKFFQQRENGLWFLSDEYINQQPSASEAI